MNKQNKLLIWGLNTEVFYFSTPDENFGTCIEVDLIAKI
jgi:hypothetical protein